MHFKIKGAYAPKSQNITPAIILLLSNYYFLNFPPSGSGRYPSFDYISVTPPYVEVNYSTLLDQLARSPLVGEDCFILVEYPLKTDMPESCGDLIKIADRRFGRTNLLIYGPTWSAKKKGTILR
ncbi:hypothetical protein ACQ4PT_066297 [Festuca glaucescens]